MRALLGTATHFCEVVGDVGGAQVKLSASKNETTLQVVLDAYLQALPDQQLLLIRDTRPPSDDFEPR